MITPLMLSIGVGLAVSAGTFTLLAFVILGLSQPREEQLDILAE